MSRNYDNWERLVAAVIKKQQLLKLFHAQSRSPSDISDASDISSSTSSFNDVSFGNSIPYNLQEAPVYESNNPVLVFISDYEPVFDLEDLLRASSEILGKGKFGSFCTAKLQNGITVVVKRLKMVNISEQDFKTHMRIIGDVKHENVAALRAYYYSSAEKLLVYDYYDQGTLFTTLHGNKQLLDWNMRLNIAVGAAKGIAHIHTKNEKRLVHGNISASNILLDEQRCRILSDVGFGKSVRPTTSFITNNAGYCAPEVTDNRNVSQASDVYSFGVVLLELLTGELPLTTFDGEAMSLVRWTEIVGLTSFDAEVWRSGDVDKAMVQMMVIAIYCVDSVPHGRPNMADIVKMLENIRDTVTGRYYLQPPQVNKSKKNPGLVFIPEVEPIFDLRDLLRASHQVLGEGTFGTSYKATLENGIIVYVKRLEDVIVTNEEFQQHMEVIGRIGHKNVAEVKAYYYSREKKLLVYHYYSQGSLSARLHGGRDSGKRPLKWYTRLKIAVDAARGIAYIHAKNGQKLVHGNIKASNILLYNQQYGIVSDVGLGRLVSPKTFFGTSNAGYCAPEVTDSRKVSQASDVYSFGVVLLEILSRQLPQTTYKGVTMTLVNRTQAVVTEEWASQVFDVELLRYEDVEEEMVRMMQIAMNCVALLPERRPKMNNVVKMLEEIAGL